SPCARARGRTAKPWKKLGSLARPLGVSAGASPSAMPSWETLEAEAQLRELTSPRQWSARSRWCRVRGLLSPRLPRQWIHDAPHSEPARLGRRRDRDPHRARDARLPGAAADGAAPIGLRGDPGPRAHRGPARRRCPADAAAMARCDDSVVSYDLLRDRAGGPRLPR